MEAKKTHRTTRQRQVILGELKKLTCHPTAMELYEIVRQVLPRVSLGTVYRNLEFLARDGTIQKLETGGKESRFDGTPDRHSHVRCLVCGRVDDAHHEPEDLAEDSLTHLNGYEILGHRLEYFGYCPECRKNRKLKMKEPLPGSGQYRGKEIQK